MSSFSVQNAIVSLIAAPVLILFGAFVTWAAVTDAGGWFSAWYEAYKDSKMGFWSVSRNERQFRAWHVAGGVVFVVVGALVLQIVL